MAPLIERLQQALSVFQSVFKRRTNEGTNAKTRPLSG